MRGLEEWEFILCKAFYAEHSIRLTSHQIFIQVD